MAVRPIVLLGDPRLYGRSIEVEEAELGAMRELSQDLHDTMRAFQEEHGWGRAIAAPQIGVARRVIAVNWREPMTMINPSIDQRSEQTCEHWEDCMSFPELLVRIENPVSCRVRYRDLQWREREVHLTEDFAELIQHEVDHLDGVLSVMRAIDERSIVLRRAVGKQVRPLAGQWRERAQKPT